MLKATVNECLSLPARKPVSKRRLRGILGYSAAQFEAAYAASLVAEDLPRGTRTVLLLDMFVPGEHVPGSGGSARAANPELTVVAATAGQMTVKAVVADMAALLT